MQSPSADLPMLGPRGDDDQVARLEPGRQPVEVAEARTAMPVTSAPASYSAVIRSKLSFSSSSMWLNSVATPLLREVEDDLLGPVDELGGLARPLPAEPRDLAARADEAAQRRHLADDPRVVARRSRSRGRAPPARGCATRPPTSSSSPRSSSSSTSVIASTGSPLRVEVERGAVDLRVALAVEVAARRGPR